jgi:hypothetical protein
MSWRISTRAEPRPGARWWVSAALMAVTAGVVAYFFDPQRGRARRIRFAQRARPLVPAHLLHPGEQVAGASQGWPEEPPPDVDSEG